MKNLILFRSRFAGGCLAIALASSPVCPKEQFPVLRTPQNATFELDIPLHADPASANHTVANASINADAVVLNQNLHPGLAQGLPTAAIASTEEPVHSIQSPQSASSLVGPFVASTATQSVPPSHVVQADTATPTPPSPASSSNPTLSKTAQFTVEPYFFIPLHVQADVTVAGRSTSINAGFRNILNLDRALDAGLRFETRQNRLGFILDGFYIHARQSGTLGATFPQGTLQSAGINTDVRLNANANVSVNQGMLDLAAFYRVLDTPLGNSPSSADSYPRLVVEPILGLRINILQQRIAVNTIGVGNLTLPVDQRFNFSRGIVEPLVGARIRLSLSERWALALRGDVSGFDINADRDTTWNLFLDTQYRLSPSTSLQLGYRFNNFDFQDGAGLRRVKLNLRQNGLWLGVIFQI